MIFMIAFLIIPVFAGWLAGLIVNYLGDVLPKTRSLSRPTCLQCDQEFSTRAYLLLQRCENGHSRSRRAWITQVLGVVVGIYVWMQPPEKLGYLLGLILAIYLG